GRRMLSSMPPVIAWKGREAYALGGRGGSLIPTSVIEVLLDLLVDGDPLQAALDRPRLHHQWLPDRLEAEPDALSPETRAELERRGQTTLVSRDTAKIHAVHRLPDGRVEAASDPRGSGIGGVVTAEERRHTGARRTANTSRAARRASPSTCGEKGFCRQTGEAGPPSQSCSSL